MKTLKSIALSLVAFVLLTGAASQEKGISAKDLAAPPEVFCTVVEKPDPALLGAWQCVHERYRAKKGETDPEPVQFVLKQVGDQYALYFFRSKPHSGRVYRGWKDWTIRGSEIVSDTGVRIFAKGGEVYYGWQTDEPTKMTRFEPE